MRLSSTVTAAALLALAAPAVATIMVPLSLEELTGEASAIVRGRVVDRSSAWDDTHQRIYTTTVLEVTETVWAAQPLGAQIRVRTLGGEVDGIGMRVAGTPDLKLGDDVLLFLRPDARVAASFAVIGMNQGRFSVRTDTAGRLMATPTWEGIAFAKPGHDGVLRVSESHELPAEQPYIDLRNRIVAMKAQSVAPAPGSPAAPAAPAAPGVPSAPVAPGKPASK